VVEIVRLAAAVACFITRQKDVIWQTKQHSCHSPSAAAGGNLIRAKTRYIAIAERLFVKICARFHGKLAAAARVGAKFAEISQAVYTGYRLLLQSDTELCQWL